MIWWIYVGLGLVLICLGVWALLMRNVFKAMSGKETLQQGQAEWLARIAGYHRKQRREGRDDNAV